MILKNQTMIYKNQTMILSFIAYLSGKETKRGKVGCSVREKTEGCAEGGGMLQGKNERPTRKGQEVCEGEMESLSIC